MVTVVLIHGAWHGASCWDQVIGELDCAGVTAHAVELPLTGYLDDVATVRDTLDNVSGRKVIVAHSYGGLVLSGAAQGRGDIAHLVYLCAFLLDEGERVLDNMMDLEPPKLFDALRTAEDGRIYIDPAGAVAAFYAECPERVADAAVARLRPMDPNSTTHACLGEPWKTIPTTYMVCQRDEAINPEAQQRMAKRAGNVVELDTDHSPFLSKVPETVRVIMDTLH